MGKKLNEIQRYAGRNKTTLVALALLFALLITWAAVAALQGIITGQGTLAIATVPAGTSVYLDEDLIERVEEGQAALSIDVAPGTHHVLIAHPETWPWAKQITVADKELITLSPFLITKQIRAQEISPENSASVRELFSATPPTRENPHVASNDSTALFIEDGRGKALWQSGSGTPPDHFCAPECMHEIAVTPLGRQATYIDFWENSDRVAVATIEDTVIVLDIDARDIQNAQPLFNEGAADFRYGEDGTLYFTDGETYYQYLPNGQS